MFWSPCNIIQRLLSYENSRTLVDEWMKARIAFNAGCLKA